MIKSLWFTMNPRELKPNICYCQLEEEIACKILYYKFISPLKIGFNFKSQIQVQVIETSFTKFLIIVQCAP